MKALKAILIGVGALILLLVGVGLFLPSAYHVERSTVINAPVGVVFAHLNNYKKHEVWSPWRAQDPTMAWTYGDKWEGEGAAYSWTSENSGSGTQRITRSVTNKRIETVMAFEGMSGANGYYDLTEISNGVEVLWGFEGDVGLDIPGRYMVLGMDAMVGPYFVDGLARLKQVTESAQPVAVAPPPPAP